MVGTGKYQETLKNVENEKLCRTGNILRKSKKQEK
jgi:hypothetical protein